jgi:hypothetical protein
VKRLICMPAMGDYEMTSERANAIAVPWRTLLASTSPRDVAGFRGEARPFWWRPEIGSLTREITVSRTYSGVYLSLDSTSVTSRPVRCLERLKIWLPMALHQHELRHCFSSSSKQKLFNISHHIESCGICMEH